MAKISDFEIFVDLLPAVLRQRSKHPPCSVKQPGTIHRGNNKQRLLLYYYIFLLVVPRTIGAIGILFLVNLMEGLGTRDHIH